MKLMSNTAAFYPMGAVLLISFMLYLQTQLWASTESRFKSIDYSAEAIRRSSWPIRYCWEKSNRTHKHNELL